MPASEIARQFHDVCRERGNAIAIIDLATGRRTSFRALREQFRQTRLVLADAGIGEGDVVVTIAGNRVEFVALFVACLDLGAVLVPVGEATDTEAVAIAERAGASAIVCDRILPLPATSDITLSDDLRVLVIRPRPTFTSPGSSLVLKLTSGSSDLPKATPASERNLIADNAHITTGMGITAADVNLALIPLSHAYAIGNIVVPLVLQGVAMALRPSFNPSQFAGDVDASGATVFPGVPFMFQQLRTALAGRALPDSLRLLITAGAPIDGDTVRWFLTETGRKIHSFYGSSETGGITYDDSDTLNDPLHVGRPLPGVTVEIREQPGGGDGRVFVKGNAVAAGYAHGPGDALSQFVDGGFLTGDLGHIGADGLLFLTGRVSPLVNVAGRKVDPAEVDRVIRALPGISDARALGMSSATRGEELVAFVVRTDRSLSALDLRRRCAETLSPYKIPRRFIFVDALPVDARGKVDRRALAALAEAAH